MNTATPVETIAATAPGAVSALARLMCGAVAVAVASVPLAVGYSFYGFYSNGRVDSFFYVTCATAVVVLFALIISVFAAVIFGMPIYLLTLRAGGLRIPLFLAGGALVGGTVHEMWSGLPSGEFFADPLGILLFAFFGCYSSAAFWLGAEVWGVGRGRRLPCPGG